MPAPKEFYNQLISRIMIARSKDDKLLVDKLLDVWWDASQRATEWDARQWDFDPDLWCREERSIIAARALREQRNNTTSS